MNDVIKDLAAALAHEFASIFFDSNSSGSKKSSGGIKGTSAPPLKEKKKKDNAAPRETRRLVRGLRSLEDCL